MVGAMTEWCIEIKDMFLEFAGTGWLHWMLAVLVLVVCSIKNKCFRYKFLYPVIIVLAIFFCPPVYGTIGIRFMNGMYWRMLWLIPITVIIGYGAVCVCMYFKSYAAKALMLAGIASVIAAFGQPVFSEDNYVPAQNIYQLPQVTIDVADAIEEDAAATNQRPVIVLPDEMICSLRQYTVKLRLLYGRNAYSYIFSELPDMEAAVHNEMVKEAPDVEILAKFAKAKNVEYIVFNGQYHTGVEGIEFHGYTFLKNVDGYNIYKKADA